MDFRLTKEQEMMQKLCREFAVNEIEPIAAEIDAEERYPWETVRKLQKYGLLGIQFPKELGGAGGDNICYTIEENTHNSGSIQLFIKDIRPSE